MVAETFRIFVFFWIMFSANSDAKCSYSRDCCNYCVEPSIPENIPANYYCSPSTPNEPQAPRSNPEVCGSDKVSPRLTNPSVKANEQYNYLMNHLGNILQNWQTPPTPLLKVSRTSDNQQRSSVYECAENYNCDKSTQDALIHPVSAFNHVSNLIDLVLTPTLNDFSSTIPPTSASRPAGPRIHHVIGSFMTLLPSIAFSRNVQTTSVPSIYSECNIQPTPSIPSSSSTLIPPVSSSREVIQPTTLIPPISSTRVLSSSVADGHYPGCGCNIQTTPSISSSTLIPPASFSRETIKPSSLPPPISSTRVFSSSVANGHAPGCGCNIQTTPSISLSSSTSIPPVSFSRDSQALKPIPPISSTRVFSSSVANGHAPGCGCNIQATPSLTVPVSFSRNITQSTSASKPSSTVFSSSIADGHYPGCGCFKSISSTPSQVFSTSSSSTVFSTASTNYVHSKSAVVLKPLSPLSPTYLIHPTSASRNLEVTTDIPSFNDNLPDDVVAAAMSKMFKDLNKAIANSQNENVEDNSEISLDRAYNVMKYFDHYKEYLPYLRSTNENLNRNYNQYPLYSPCQCN